MAEHLYLIRRTTHMNDERNRVRDILINNDDGDSDAVKIQNAVDAMNTAQPRDGGSPTYPDGYFDFVLDVTELSGTGQDNLRTVGGFITWGPEIATRLTQAV